METDPLYVLAEELREKGVVYKRGDSLVIEEPYRTMLIEQHAAREAEPGEILARPATEVIDALIAKHGMVSARR